MRVSDERLDELIEMGEHNTLPDLGELLAWLMRELDEARAQLAAWKPIIDALRAQQKLIDAVRTGKVIKRRELVEADDLVWRELAKLESDERRAALAATEGGE